MVECMCGCAEEFRSMMVYMPIITFLTAVVLASLAHSIFPFISSWSQGPSLCNRCNGSEVLCAVFVGCRSQEALLGVV